MYTIPQRVSPIPNGDELLLWFVRGKTGSLKSGYRWGAVGVSWIRKNCLRECVGTTWTIRIWRRLRMLSSGMWWGWLCRGIKGIMMLTKWQGSGWTSSSLSSENGIKEVTGEHNSHPLIDSAFIVLQINRRYKVLIWGRTETEEQSETQSCSTETRWRKGSLTTLLGLSKEETRYPLWLKRKTARESCTKLGMARCQFWSRWFTSKESHRSSTSGSRTTTWLASKR